VTLPRTPSQTIGPYLAIAMQWPRDGRFVVPQGAPGAIWIRGRILDGLGEPVDDGVVETWQANPGGRFPATTDTGFRGFGRAMTDEHGSWAVHTVKPGRVAGADGRLAAPHVSVAIFGRGLLKPIWTRIYFGDEPEANAVDPVLGSLDAMRRSTLVATPSGDGYKFDVWLQGPGETVFFDV
jgi:protocatechuate 3,4-dioxygenase alpha subunit